jgi:hypothetical protein
MSTSVVWARTGEFLDNDVTPPKYLRSAPVRQQGALREGEVLSGRFVIERRVGEGGMATVYRALDRANGAPVAIKVMSVDDPYRFAQEARVLAGLSHPAIVGHVANGMTADGRLYLAMEWLQGETLSERIARGGLAVADSLEVVRRVAEGLAAAHLRGIVHRDVKPSNILLVGDDPRRAKLLDFGIVHLQMSPHAPTAPPMTGTGTVLGTVGYMAPEQAGADRALDPRADIFSLGCVLFECLTGEAAFSGAHVVAVLAKVLREDAPRIRQLRPELPVQLDDLVARMLSKDRNGRPEDGGALLDELESIGIIPGKAPCASARPPSFLSGGEQRLVSVMLVVAPDGIDVGPVAHRHGGELVKLANGALLVTHTARLATSEQVVAAAVCALELHQAFPSARIALATGRAQTNASGPTGPVIDRAAALLEHSVSSGIRIDEVTGGLLGERFEIHAVGGGHVLVAQRDHAEPPRTLLGKPTPYVGRDKELGFLELTLQECVEESVARAVVVTGPAGQGKSRLRHEFVNKVRARGDVTVLTGRADPVGAGSAFMLARQLVRQAVGLLEGEPAEEQQARLRAHVAEVCRTKHSARVADFLAELIGAPSTELPSAELRSARNDPQIMGVWLARSFVEWLAAECARRPLLVVLEDLHWGDLPSVTYIGEALRALSAMPFMVLALGRPELPETFPGLWAGADPHELSLGRLTPRAAERLVRAVLGSTVSSHSVAQIVRRADGNSLYLEELIRRVAEGGSDALPETVLALVQSRLERLEPRARRIVRAASVFGEVFWRGGLASLLGAGQDSGDLDEWLKTLTEREVLMPAPESRFPGDVEYVFRHGLVRDAAYAMLTEADRTTGHRLAGEWLERAGEKDALMLAEHFERGADPKRSVPWLVQATQAALGNGDIDATVALGHRGVASGAEGIELGLIRQAQGMALHMRGDMSASMRASQEAMGLLTAGSTPWFASAADIFFAAMSLGDTGITGQAMRAILETKGEPTPSGPYGFAVGSMCLGLALAGHMQVAQSFLARAEAIQEAASDPDLVFLLHLRLARGILGFMRGDIGGGLASLREGQKLAERTGDTFGRVRAEMYAVAALAQTGHCEATEKALHSLQAFCEPRGLTRFSSWGAHQLDVVRVSAGRGAEAKAGLVSHLQSPDRLMASIARAALAHAHLQAGELAQAVSEAKATLESALPFPIAQSLALAALAFVEVREGSGEAALAYAERGLELDLRAPAPWAGSVLRLARAEALHALGRLEEAKGAIRDARERVLLTGATLDHSPVLRHSFTAGVEANRRTVALAEEWLGKPVQT